MKKPQPDISTDMFDSLSFEDAVRLFQKWGFIVEPGPMPKEVTLIIDAPDHRTYCVYEAEMLPQIAAAALRVRFKTGRLLERPAIRGRNGNSRAGSIHKNDL